MTEPCSCVTAPKPEGFRVRCRLCGTEYGSNKHPCHAEGCDVEVPPKMLMCLKHWRRVPKLLQQRIWATYVAGQEIRKDPTDAYMEAQEAAVEAVAQKEGRR